MSINRPVIAVAVCVIKDSKILLGKRKKTPEIDSWQLPGGLLNDKETVFESSLRVVSRKVGVHIEDLDSGPYTNNIFTQPDYHSVSLYVSARYISGDVDASNYDQAED